MAKRLLDIAVSAVGLIVLTPVLAVCALMVRRGSPGQILYSQPRLGLHGRPFRLWKFRTMHAGAPDVRNADGSAFSGNHDPRVTPAGRFLRATSLDELPQLWNVLRGDMSLVGPRPDQVDQRRFYTASENRKLDVKPGLTGLAQISGRNQIPWEKRKALDVEYVERQSMWLDLRILGKTIPYVCLRKNIHSGA
jgi:lipopolysaccharide/colanic/teichoic acid biosynthesis glycosyltransferase